MQTKNNIVKKVMNSVSGLALLVSLEGCGTTIHYLDPETKGWYDCNTNEDYPVGHPCYNKVAEYNKNEGRNNPFSKYYSSNEKSCKELFPDSDYNRENCENMRNGWQPRGHHL